MRIYHVHLWGDEDVERRVAYIVKGRSIEAVRRFIPTVLARHRATRQHFCTYTRWSITGRRPADTLIRILAAGRIHNGRIIDDGPDNNNVAGGHRARAS